MHYQIFKTAKAIDPPLLVQDDGVIGRVRTTPAGITVVRNDGAVKPLQIGSNWQITDLKENQLRTAIRQAFYSDQLQLQEGPQMTATEVQVRYELMQRLLGPTLGRFQSEFLNPLIERVFGIMYRAGALLPEPSVVRGAIMDNIDHDEAVRLRGKLLGVPKTVLRGKDQVNEMRNARAEQQQMAQMAQQQQAQAQAMKTQAEASKTMSDPNVQAMLGDTAEDMGISENI
jgi:hypothetical protein